MDSLNKQIPIGEFGGWPIYAIAIIHSETKAGFDVIVECKGMKGTYLQMRNYLYVTKLNPDYNEYFGFRDKRASIIKTLDGNVNIACLTGRATDLSNAVNNVSNLNIELIITNEILPVYESYDSYLDNEF
jgi:hypothetical protein